MTRYLWRIKHKVTQGIRARNEIKHITKNSGKNEYYNAVVWKIGMDHQALTFFGSNHFISLLSLFIIFGSPRSLILCHLLPQNLLMYPFVLMGTHSYNFLLICIWNKWIMVGMTKLPFTMSSKSWIDCTSHNFNCFWP